MYEESPDIKGDFPNIPLRNPILMMSTNSSVGKCLCIFHCIFVEEGVFKIPVVVYISLNPELYCCIQVFCKILLYVIFPIR